MDLIYVIPTIIAVDSGGFESLEMGMFTRKLEICW